jgi:hypothetical protein
MTIKELKERKDYEFECIISERNIFADYYDEWGCAFASVGKNKIVEYNFCIDNTTNESVNCSAIYKVDYNDKTGYIETDCNTFTHYEINFDKTDWKEKLEDAMCEALIKFFNL